MNKPIPKLTEKQLEKFWSRVDKSGDCWVWTGAKVRGYGTANVPTTFYAHRISYFLANDIDPGESMVCHKCDTPACVNPDHLWLGNDLDNQQDSISCREDHLRELVDVMLVIQGSVVIYASWRDY